MFGPSLLECHLIMPGLGLDDVVVQQRLHIVGSCTMFHARQVAGVKSPKPKVLSEGRCQCSCRRTCQTSRSKACASPTPTESKARAPWLSTRSSWSAGPPAKLANARLLIVASLARALVCATVGDNNQGRGTKTGVTQWLKTYLPQDLPSQP